MKKNDGCDGRCEKHGNWHPICVQCIEEERDKARAERDELRAQVAAAVERLDEFGSCPTLADGIQAMKLRMLKYRAQVERVRLVLADNQKDIAKRQFRGEEADEWDEGYETACDAVLAALEGK